MEIEKIIKISIIFLLGFLSANLFGIYLIYGIEMPVSLTGFSIANFSFTSNNNPAPFDFVKEDQIQVFDDKIVINVKDASLSRYAPTGSMKPLLDEGSNGIRIVPKSEDEIQVGDIITFEQSGMLIVHRVVEIGSDNDGVYFVTKGDNNMISDGKIKFEDIRYKTIGIIW